MKKSLFRRLCFVGLTFALGTIAGNAEYKNMIFRTVDGSVYSIGTESLVINYADGLISAVNAADERLDLPTAQLVSMQFSDDESSIAGIDFARCGQFTVYDLKGEEIGRFSSLSQAGESLPRGLYLIKTNEGQTIKALIGK